MSKHVAHHRKFKITGISQPSARDKFTASMKKTCSIKTVPNTGSYVSLHIKADMADNSTADVTIFSNDTITVSASPHVTQANFEELVRNVQKTAETSIKSLSTTRPLALARAKELIDYATSLSPSDEKQRMVVIILCDTANEIILTEKLQSLNITGSPLNEGIPDKIRRIKGKGEDVYRESEILVIRERRNDIVHRGNIPMKTEADKVVEISSDFVNKA
jgi:hypothetical protein